MAGFIDESILDDILGRVDIVEVVSAYIPLKRAGRNFKACCPFHKEKTASFMVSAEKQIYHCFGCGAGGNAFNFLMQYERMEFPEAVEHLARKAGIILPERHRQDRQSNGTVTQIHKINEAAAMFYQSSLRSTRAQAAHRYLENRRITPHTAKTFRLGYAPDEWDGLVRHLNSHKFDLELAQKAGLVIAGKDRGFYDRFRGRIVFPITDARSAVIAFGARVLDKSLPKYINSPETPVYVKGNHLYGLDLAKEAIRQEDKAVVVEGYLDCIMPYQAGMRNIVASLGTALTPQQARLLKRYTHNVCLVYDGDMAGQAASIRSLEIFIDEGINLTVAVLPEGFDPDSFTAARGIEAFSSLIAGAATIFDYKLKFLMGRTGKAGAESKAAVVSDMLSTIARFKNAVLRSEYIKKLSEALDVDESALLTELSRAKAGIRTDEGALPSGIRPSAVHPTEKLLIKLMLEESSLIEQIRDRLDPEDFQDSRTSRIVRLMLELTSSGKPLAPGAILNHVGSDEAMRLVCESTFLPDVPEAQKRVIVEDCIARLKNARQASRRQKLQSEIKKAQDKGDHELLNRLFIEFHSLIKKG